VASYSIIYNSFCNLVFFTDNGLDFDFILYKLIMLQENYLRKFIFSCALYIFL